jgi:hypothetical protein
MLARCRACAFVLMAAGAAAAQETSLRLGGKDVPLAPVVQARLASLAREMFSRCGPNTLQHPGNFGLAALGAEKRWATVIDGSRLRIRFAEPFVTTSHLGGTLGVSETVVGLEQPGLFVGPNFSRHGARLVEHLQCEYLPALELACLPALAPHLPASYRETCARLERDPQGRVVMPTPDIAPSCS